MKKTRKPATLTPATVRKYLHDVKIRMEKWDAVPAEHVPICFSSGNSKLGPVWNVSLAPGITCGNAAECLSTCYAMRDLWRPSTRDARARNTSLFYRDRDLFFARCAEFIARKRAHKYFRFHVAGEIVDIDHLTRMVALARRFPEWTFWTYTKMYTIAAAYIRENGPFPGNFHLMLSAWLDIPVYNPYNLPTFHTVAAPTGKKWICPGDCQVCVAAARGCVAGEPTECAHH